MIGANDILWGAVAPAAVAAAVFAIVRWAAARYDPTGAPSAAWTAALVCGYVAGHWGIDAASVGLAEAVRSSFRPHEARDWLPAVLVLLAVPDGVARFGRIGWLAALDLRPLVCALAAWRLFSLHKDYPTSELVRAGLSDSAWTWGEVITSIVALALAVTAVWMLARVGRDRPSGWVRAIAACGTSAGAAAVLALSGSLLCGQLMGIVAAAVGGTGLAALVTKSNAGPEASPGPLLGAFFGILLWAYLFTDNALAPVSAAVLAAAMTLALAPLPKAIPTRIGEPLRVAVCLLLVVGVVAAAGMAFAESQQPTAEPEAPAANPYGQYR